MPPLELFRHVEPGDRVDGAVIVASRPLRKLVLRLSWHYALGVRVVPATSDLRRTSWLARWLRLQVRLLWFPADAPIIYSKEAEQVPFLDLLRIHGFDPRRHRLVPAAEIAGWYVRRLPWWRRA